MLTFLLIISFQIILVKEFSFVVVGLVSIVGLNMWFIERDKKLFDAYQERQEVLRILQRPPSTAIIILVAIQGRLAPRLSTERLKCLIFHRLMIMRVNGIVRLVKSMRGGFISKVMNTSALKFLQSVRLMKCKALPTPQKDSCSSCMSKLVLA